MLEIVSRPPAAEAVDTLRDRSGHVSASAHFIGSALGCIRLLAAFGWCWKGWTARPLEEAARGASQPEICLDHVGPIALARCWMRIIVGFEQNIAQADRGAQDLVIPDRYGSPGEAIARDTCAQPA